MSKKLFKIHSWLAIVSFLPIALIALTGSILVFKPEIDRWLMPEKVALIQASGQRIMMDDLMLEVNSQFPGYEIGTWEMFDDHHQADIVYLIKHGTMDWHKIYLNPYTGKVLSEPVSLTHYLTDFLLELHYRIFLDVWGLTLIGLYGLALLILSITGFILYRKFWKRFFTLRWNKRLIIFMSDFHKMVGILASPVLLILSFTGVYWNIAEILHETVEHADEHDYVMTQRMYNSDLNFNDLLSHTQKRLGDWEVTYAVFAFEPEGYIAFYGKEASKSALTSDYSSGVAYDPQSGEFKYQWDVASTSGLGLFLDSFRTLHFGIFGGLLTRVLWCILGAAPLLLVISGLVMWSIRRKKKTVPKVQSRQTLVFEQ